MLHISARLIGRRQVFDMSRNVSLLKQALQSFCDSINRAARIRRSAVEDRQFAAYSICQLLIAEPDEVIKDDRESALRLFHLKSHSHLIVVEVITESHTLEDAQAQKLLRRSIKHRHIHMLSDLQTACCNNLFLLVTLQPDYLYLSQSHGCCLLRNRRRRN